MRRRKDKRTETGVSRGMEFRESPGPRGLKLRHHGDKMSFEQNLREATC